MIKKLSIMLANLALRANQVLVRILVKFNQLNSMMVLIKWQDKNSKLGVNGITKRHRNF